MSFKLVDGLQAFFFGAVAPIGLDVAPCAERMRVEWLVNVFMPEDR